MYIKLMSAVFLNLKTGGGSSGASPQLKGRSLRCVFLVSYLTTCLSLLVILVSLRSQANQTFLLQTFLPWEQQVAGSWISHQSLLLHFCPIFPFLNISFHWAWVLRIPFGSAPQTCQLSENLHRWSVFMTFMVSLHWCSTDRINSSLRSVGMLVLEQAAIFWISHNLHEFLRTINALKFDFNFLTRIIWYTV